MKGVPVWRIATGVVVLLALAAIAAVLTPIYLHNLQFQFFVADLTQTTSPQNTSDGDIRGRVLAKANSLNLPVTAGDVLITRSGGGLRIDVRYYVTVNLPGYTVGLHFHPAAGSR